jgi:arylsulfatase A-like enzyme
LLVDCLRADKCYGKNSTAKTSTINSLRKKGTTFLNVISSASFTLQAVASIFTGIYPFLHLDKEFQQIRKFSFNTNTKTIAEVFQENGYTTYADVTGPLAPQFGFNKGFHFYNFRKGSDKTNNVYSMWGDLFLKKLKNKEYKEPWFLFTHFFELHLPRKIQKNAYGKSNYDKALSSFDDKLKEIFESVNLKKTVIVFTADHGEKIAKNVFQELYSKLFVHTRRYIHRHKFLTAVIKKIKRTREVPRPEGHAFGVYDYQIKVPLILVGERIFPENQEISDMVRQVDIFPTLIDSLNLSVQGDFKIHGRSIMPLLRNQKICELPAYFETAWGPWTPKYRRQLAGIRTSKYKFIYIPSNEKILPELYDLLKDPGEKNNIINEENEIALDLKKKLLDIQSKNLGLKISKKQKLSKEDERIIEERLKKLGYL